MLYKKNSDWLIKGEAQNIDIGLKWHQSAGPVEIKFVPVRHESYQKLTAGPACISDAEIHGQFIKPNNVLSVL